MAGIDFLAWKVLLMALSTSFLSQELIPLAVCISVFFQTLAHAQQKMHLDVLEAIFIRAVKREFTYHLTSFFQSFLILHTRHSQNKMLLDVMEAAFIRAVKPELTYHFSSFFQTYLALHTDHSQKKMNSDVMEAA